MSARLTGFFTGVGDTNRPKVQAWELMDMMAMVRFAPLIHVLGVV